MIEILQSLSILEAKVNVTGKKYQKYPIGAALQAVWISGIGHLMGGYFMGPRRYQWVFDVATYGHRKLKWTIVYLAWPLLRVKGHLVLMGTVTVAK